ncbi:MAG: hypothetical protein PF495_03825 [Spirochaetales bacterium]|jgi:hypothetical protein|nr:hypothetical protein [Spirochaetales bacterium]
MNWPKRISMKLFVNVLIGVMTFILAEQGKVTTEVAGVFITITGAYNVMQGKIDQQSAVNGDNSHADRQ